MDSWSINRNAIYNTPADIRILSRTSHTTHYIDFNRRELIVVYVHLVCTVPMYHARENKIPTSQRNRSWSTVPYLVVPEFATTIRTRPIVYVDYYERDELVLSVSRCEFPPDKCFLTMATYNIDRQVGPCADNAECRTLSASQS